MMTTARPRYGMVWYGMHNNDFFSSCALTAFAGVDVIVLERINWVGIAGKLGRPPAVPCQCNTIQYNTYEK